MRATVIACTSTTVIQSKIKTTVESDSVLCTDEHAAYRGMKQYHHKAVNHSTNEYVDGMAHTNRMESVWSVLKRGFYGVYHQFSEKLLQRYVDEFTYRLNEGSCKIHTYDRFDSLLNKKVGIRIAYKALIAK